MAYKFAVANIPYNVADIRLGSLVPNRKRPNQDAFWPANFVALNEGQDYAWRNVQNFSFAGHAWKEGSAGARLAGLLSFSVSGKNDKKESLCSREGRIYELKQPKRLFARILQSDDASPVTAGEPPSLTEAAKAAETTENTESAREVETAKITEPANDTKPAQVPDKSANEPPGVKSWLLQQHDEGEDVYFIVGCRTFFDVTEIDEASASYRAEGKLAAPLPEPTTAATDAPVKTVELEGHKSGGKEQNQSFTVPEERIYAVYYRRVVFRWFAGDDAAETVKLHRHETQWVVNSARKRGQPSTLQTVGVALGDAELGGEVFHIDTGDHIEEYYVDSESEAYEDESDDLEED